MPTARDLVHPGVVAPSLDDVVARTPARLTPRWLSLFVRACFEQLGRADDRVAALGMTPAAVLDHLTGAPTRRDLGRVSFGSMALADVAAAAACVTGDAAAWAIVHSYEPLVRQALAGVPGESHPALAARTFFQQIREATESDSASSLNLRRYSGERPLRVWLVDRVLGTHAHEIRGPRNRAVIDRRLRLALENLDSQREHVRAVVGLPPAVAVDRLLTD